MRASGTPSRLGIFGGCSSLAEAKGRRGGASTFSVDLIARIPCSTPRFRERRQPISAGFQTTCKPGGLDWLRSPPGSSKGPHASAPPAGSKNRRPPLMQRSPSRNKTNNPTFCHSHRTISSRAIEYRPAPYVSTTRAAFRCFLLLYSHRTCRWSEHIYPNPRRARPGLCGDIPAEFASYPQCRAAHVALCLRRVQKPRAGDIDVAPETSRLQMGPSLFLMQHRHELLGRPGSRGASLMRSMPNDARAPASMSVAASW